MPFWFVAAPEIILLGLICTVLIADLFIDDEHRNITFWLSIATLLLTLFVIYVTGGGRQIVFDGAYVSDPLSRVLKIAVVGFVAIAFFLRA